MHRNRDNKASWRTVRFGDVVRNVKVAVERDKNPYERYVTGAHMRTEDIHIREWGEFGHDYVGPAFHRRFLKGQVLYGSRRTYLKKVALAEFDGVTANTTFVLETRDQNVLLQELLPFLMLTDGFTEHAVRESKGSTNPYINWPDIAKYEFPLPPKDEQRRIADILWAAEENTEAQLTAKGHLASLLDAMVRQFLAAGLPGRHSQLKTTNIGTLPTAWECAKCASLFAEPPRNGYSPKAESYGGGYPTLSIGCVRNGRVTPEGNLKFAKIGDDVLERYRLKSGDLLVVRGNGNRDLAARCAIVEEVPENCFYPDLLIRIRFKPDLLLPEFAALQWNSSRVHRRLLSFAKSTNGIWKINGNDLRQHLLAVPPPKEQEEFLAVVRGPRDQLHRMDGMVNAARHLKSTLVNRLLSDPR